MSRPRCPQAWGMARRMARHAQHEQRRQQLTGHLGPAQAWRIEQLLAAHGDASMAAVLLVLALVTLLPVGGLGALMSLVIAAWALAWARQRETMPGLQRLARMPLPAAIVPRSLRWLARLHLLRARWLRPRYQALLAPVWRWPWALWVWCMALVIFLPIPFGNMLPALSLLMLGLSLMARDGLLLLASLAPGGAGLVVLGLSADWLSDSLRAAWPVLPT